jgi:hypothetical protein
VVDVTIRIITGAMTFKEFQRLSDSEKADCLWDKGNPVATREREHARFILYQLDAFYVEAEYRADFLEIVVLKTFQINEIPLIYLEQVNISGLKV